MYDRDYKGKTLRFEASGGLINSSLVMQDFETDSYWAIMSGESIAGEFKGTKLVELPISKKMKWQDWVKLHPNTLVLSVAGREDGHNPYGSYFSSSEGFRGTSAKDRRLPTKEPIFAFRWNGKNYAVAQKSIRGGKAYKLNGINVFFYRPKKAEMFHSTVVYTTIGDGFKQTDGEWVDRTSGCVFNPETEQFDGNAEKCPKRRIVGFDTFWYNWSLANPDTEVLK